MPSASAGFFQIYQHMHPLSDFKYCPHCGSAHFAENDPFSKRCAECGFTFYPNASAATVAVVVNSRNELLCIVRRCDPARGTLDLPGGFVDPGEDVVAGLYREVHEELGAEVAEHEFLFSRANAYPYAGHVVHTADSFFRCTLKDESAVRALDDAAAFRWIPIASLRPEDFGLDSVRQGVQEICRRLGQASIQQP